jgi:hypothetical protein
VFPILVIVFILIRHVALPFSLHVTTTMPNLSEGKKPNQPARRRDGEKKAEAPGEPALPSAGLPFSCVPHVKAPIDSEDGARSVA